MDEEIKDTQAVEETAAESTTSAAPEETPKRKKMDPAVRKKLRYGSNLRGSAEYRRHLAETLALRCWNALKEGGA